MFTRLTPVLAAALLLMAYSPADAVQVLFVGNNAAANAGADSIVFSHLNRIEGLNLTYMQSSVVTTGDAAGHDVVILSSTPGSGNIRGKFDGIAQGVVNWEEAIADNGGGEFAFSDSISKEQNQTQLTIGSAHSINAGFSGTINYTNAPREYTGGNALGANTVDVAITNGGRPGIMALEAGALDFNGNPAPGRRVNLPMSDNTFNAISADGLELFNNAVAFAANSAPLVTNAPELIWYSKLDGNAVAIVGSDGVIGTGAPTGTADRFGNPNSALSFDGASRVDIAPEVPSLSQASIALWVNNEATDGAERGAVAVGASGGGSDQYFSLMRQNQANGNDNYRGDLDGGGVIGFAREDVLTSGLTRDWHHITLTFDLDAQELLMYVDGVLTNTEDLPTATGPLTPSNIWMIGAERVGSRFFIGDIDDVSIWGSVLNPGEIFDLATDVRTVEDLVGGVPEPTSLALLGLASVGLLRRRKHTA